MKWVKKRSTGLGRVYGDGEDIVRQGEVGNSMFVIQFGRVGVYVESDEGETLLRHLKTGDFFGELAVFDRQVRSATVRVGQELVVRPPQPVRRETYTVRRGDTVARIARRFGVPVRHVLTANGLGRRTLIRPGERLTVYVRE